MNFIFNEFLQTWLRHSLLIQVLYVLGIFVVVLTVGRKPFKYSYPTPISLLKENMYVGLSSFNF